MLTAKGFLTLSATIALAAVLSVPSVQVLAQPRAAASQAPVLTLADIQRAFAAADKNKDGKLDAAEFAILPPAIRARAVDADKDGLFTFAELTPWAEPPEIRPIVPPGTRLKSVVDDETHPLEIVIPEDLLKSGSSTVDQLIRRLTESGVKSTGDKQGGCCSAP